MRVTGFCDAVVFDMDGTLTQPVLDFDAIRAEIGLPPGPLLEAIAHFEEEPHRRAMAVIERHEAEAAMVAELRPGVDVVFDALAARGVVRAIATRNSRRSVDAVLSRHGLSVDHVDTREDGPVKPSPDPMYRVCRALGVSPGKAWMVGDYLYDLQSGSRAGMTTVLLRPAGIPSAFDHVADHVITELPELLRLLP